MNQLPIIQKAMCLFNGSFINRNNELIMIPKFNVYTLLNDVETETDFKVKLCEWFSRDCCCAMRYSQRWRLEEYWKNNTDIFNELCETDFSIDDMNLIYTKLGNGINRQLCKKFVESGFALKVLLPL